MAAPIGNENALGNRGGSGKSLNDRKLAAHVRTLALGEIANILSIPKHQMSAYESELYKAVLTRLAGTVLPRLTEVTGEDGEKLTITISKEIAEKNGINPSPSTEDNSGGPSPV